MMLLAISPSEAEAELLTALRRTPGSTVGELLRILYDDRPRDKPPASTLRSRLDQLIQRRLVVRHHDGREWRYCAIQGLAEGDCYRLALVQGHTFLAITLVKRASWTLTELHDDAPHLGTKRRILEDVQRFRDAELVQGPVGEAPERFSATHRLRSILRRQGVPLDASREDGPGSPGPAALLLLFA